MPEHWDPAYQLFLKAAKEDQRCGIISVFDGRPRPGRLSEAFKNIGLLAFSLEQKNSPKQDMLSQPGIQMFLDALSRCRANSLLWLAPECSSWVWVNWATSGRRAHRPEGLHSSCTMEANRLAEFTAFALQAATAAGATCNHL